VETFNIALDVAMEACLVQEFGIQLGEVLLVRLLFADDTVLFVESPMALSENFSRFFCALRGIRMRLNPSKCMTLYV
jgi:hypothetical protein